MNYNKYIIKKHNSQTVNAYLRSSCLLGAHKAQKNIHTFYNKNLPYYSKTLWKKTAHSVPFILKNVKDCSIFFYKQCAPSKFARFAMLFPMCLFLLSGFIDPTKPTYLKKIPLINEQLYPLKENYLPVLPIPSSGMIPVNHAISSFFTQYENSDITMQISMMPAKYQENQEYLDFINPFEPLDIKTIALIKKENPFAINLRDKHAKITINAKIPNKQFDVNNAPKSYTRRKNSYTPYAIKYAKRYQLDPKMVIAIIYAESTFYPHLVSHRNAHGLMQVVPETAGAEVQRYFKKEGEPSSAELMHPETNIRYGTAYLYLLRRYHLTGINNQQTKDILTIASYNAGSGAVLRHFGSTKSEAVHILNSMTPEEVLESIQTQFYASETRRYVAKVLAYMNYS